jgi:predicted permease
MVVLQYALSVPLLLGAVLLTVSLSRLNRVDIGCETENILTFRLSLPEGRYPAPGDVDNFREALATRLRMLPGVEGVGFGNARPPNEIPMTNNFNLEDHPTPSGQSHPTVPWLAATPDYFTTLGIPLLKGRMFNADDRLGSPEVAIVDEAWENRFFPGESAVGRRFCPAGSTDGPWTTVVGVVSNVCYTGLENPSRGTVYRPVSQLTHPSRSACTVVATATDPISLVPAVRQILHDLDPALPLTGVATIEELAGESLSSMRQMAIFTGATALIALILSIIGIYGMMANFTSRHRRDIGIHIALGGRPGRVSGMIAARGLKLAGIGLVIGVGAALFLSRVMSSLTRDVSTAGPLTIAAVSAGILGLALITCIIPAHRAVQLDPVSTLREE